MWSWMEGTLRPSAIKDPGVCLPQASGQNGSLVQREGPGAVGPRLTIRPGEAAGVWAGGGQLLLALLPGMLLLPSSHLGSQRQNV